MKKIKKALFFILGLTFIPTLLGHINALIWGSNYFKCFSGYFIMVYLLTYFTFPFIYKKNTPKLFRNKYIYYAIVYLIFWIFGVVIFVGYQA